MLLPDAPIFIQSSLHPSRFRHLSDAKPAPAAKGKAAPVAAKKAASDSDSGELMYSFTECWT